MAAIFFFRKKIERSSFQHNIGLLVHKSVQKCSKNKIISDFQRDYMVNLAIYITVASLKLAWNLFRTHLLNNMDFHPSSCFF